MLPPPPNDSPFRSNGIDRGISLATNSEILFKDEIRSSIVTLKSTTTVLR